MAVVVARTNGTWAVRQRMTSLNKMLSGGYIEHYDLDMRRNRLTLKVDVLEHGSLSNYELVFDKISQFEFETESKSNAGDRLELTELWIDELPESSPTEEWQLTISIFDMTHLSVRCSSIAVDGDLVR